MIGKIGALALLAAGGAASFAALRIGTAPVEHKDAVVGNAPARADQATPPGWIPARLFDCALARITNFDPDKEQRPADYIFEGRYRLQIFLPSIPMRTTPPPQAPQPPDPVDSRTRIVADPDGLAREPGLRFNRVVDLWPERVEMTAPISDTAVKLIVVSGGGDAKDTAEIFLANANDAVTYDLAHMYTGTCKVNSGAAAQAAGSAK
jgi:hypothetical protein